MIPPDPLLPAAPHLVGADGLGLLATAVAAAGGTLHTAELVQVQYRPGHDLVARYDAQVRWGEAPARRETLLAGVDAGGPFPGTLPLEAGDLLAGVWRYPFDPLLPGLAAAVTPPDLAARVDRWTGPITDVEVRAYRPIRRAVVHVQGDVGDVYVKVVRPAEAAAVTQTHAALAAAGIPVPTVLDVDEAAGVLVLEALQGTNLRDRLLGSTTGWPPVEDHLALASALGAVPVPAGSPPDVAATAAHHAHALATVLPRHRAGLDRILDAVAGVEPASPHVVRTIHGDLYEAQLVVDAAGRITGLLDLDDVGPGHPLDDAATQLAHLHVLRPPGRAHQTRLRAHRQRLRAALAAPDDRRDLDRRTAAVLVGLATGPFRAQSPAWRAEVRRRLLMAERLLGIAPGWRT